MPESASARLYRRLLRLFPAAFRARFADDMTATFQDRLARARAAGVHRVLGLWARTGADLVRHGLAERRRPAPATARPAAALRGFVQDVRYAARQARRQPGFTAAALITLALGIGANTAIFSAVHAVLLRPLPYPEADRLVQLYATHQRYDFTRGVLNPADLDYIASRTSSLDSLAATRVCSTTLTGAGEPARLSCLQTEATFFDIMRTRPAIGAAFTATHVGANDRVVVISHRLWTTRFGARVDLVGATITLDDQPWTVLGVMPAEFAYPAAADLWRPLFLTATERSAMGSWFLGAIARLKPAVPLEAAQRDLDRFAAELATAFPKQRADRGFRVAGLQEDLAFRSADGLRLLQGVVVIVLLIACANVANLLLAQHATRERELQLRAAVGASRGRLLRQLVTESLVLSIGGAAFGAVLAVFGLRALVALAPPFLLPAPETIGVSLEALAFTGAIAVATALLFGIAPALVAASRSGRLAVGSRTASGGLSLARRQWLRAGLVAGEVALALMLLAGAGLLMRSFALLARQDPGLDTSRLLTAQLTLPAARYATPAARQDFWRRAMDRLRALPGVTRAAGSTALPFSLWEWQTDFVVEGREDVPNEGAGTRTVTPELFATLGVPIVHGRDFLPSDLPSSERVAIVSEAFVRQHLPGMDPIGRRLSARRTTPVWATIVGVVGSTRHRDLAEATRAEIYYPLSQATAPASLLFAMKSAGDPAELAPALRAAVRDLDANLPVLELKTMDELVDAKLAEPRFATGLLGLFAVLAVALAATGVYGVMSIVVGQGRREIGIRLALGARATGVQRRVVLQGLTVVGAGAVAGLTAAYWLTTLLERELFAITPHDPWSFAGASLALCAVAMVACWLPALRVSRIDPIVVLNAQD